MCDPVSATALLLSAGGTYLESREAQKNQDRMTSARNAAFERGMIKQRQFADEAGAAFNHSIQDQGRESFDEQAAQEGDRVKQAFGSIQTQPDYNNTGMLASTPKNVVVANKEATAKADAKTNRDLNANAALKGYGGAMFNQDTSRNNFARLFGNLQDKASRESGLLPLEIQAAGNNASKSPSLFPTLMKGAGMTMGLYGAANGITSFGDKVAAGPLAPGQTWADMTQPGLFTNLKQIPQKAFGGLF